MSDLRYGHLTLFGIVDPYDHHPKYRRVEWKLVIVVS